MTDVMATIALLLFASYFVIAFGIRSWLQHRHTGDTGFRGVSGRPGSTEWTGGVLFVVALAAAVAAPVADLAGFPTISLLTHAPIQITGVALSIIGIASTYAAQAAMGASWRIGVDENESTDLVTTGAFAIVRNPIFTAMTITAVGLVLVVPNVVALAGLMGLLFALQLQVRGVEEPYLARLHGRAWDAYSAHTGRFIPHVGTVDAQVSSTARESR